MCKCATIFFSYNLIHTTQIFHCFIKLNNLNWLLFAIEEKCRCYFLIVLQHVVSKNQLEVDELEPIYQSDDNVVYIVKN
jgi:hypothetical protein